MLAPRRGAGGRVILTWIGAIFLVSVFIGGMIGCASGLSDYSRAMVTYRGTFPALQRAPDKQRGQVAMLGGRIVETKPAENGSEIMVLQLPLAARDKPSLERPSEGRFLIVTSEFLDPEAYRKLTLITVVGEVTGHVVRPVGDYPYTLPVIQPIEIKQWPATNTGVGGPSVRVGVGHGSPSGGGGFGITF